MRYLVYVIPLAMAIYALIDLSRSQVQERNGMHPALWVAVIVLLPVLGPLLWILISRLHRTDGGAGSPSPRPTRPTPPGRARPRRTGPPAPDDDPDFLWRIERERRRRAKQGPDGRPDGTGSPEKEKDAGSGEGAGTGDGTDGVSEDDRTDPRRGDDGDAR